MNNKVMKLIVSVLLAFLLLPANSYAFPARIDEILSRGGTGSKITNQLILKALNKEDEGKTIKVISDKDKVKNTTGNDNSYILGIDVSKWNGEIDWKAVKKANIKFVIIRAGYGTWYVDPYFKKNIEGAIENDMIIGIYWFSYAYTNQQAKLEADKCYETIKPYKDKIDLPVFWDFEYDSVNYANKKGATVTKKSASNMADTFCTTIKNKGFRAGIYTNIDYANRYFLGEVLAKYHTWIAQWTNSCTYKHHYIIWQCSDSYYINNKRFDLNRLYYNRYKKDVQQSKATYKTMKVSATAYSGDGVTSTGTKPKWGTIAVDPKVIPYGSVVYIPYFDKYFVAEDCGGGIKGYKIDIYMNSAKECRNWGVRTIDIKVLQ